MQTSVVILCVVALLARIAPALEPASQPASPETAGPISVDTLRPSGSLKITADNTVVENVDVTGDIWVQGAKSVVIRNFRIRGTGNFGIRIDGGASARIEHGEITGTVRSAVYGSNFVAVAVHAHHLYADAFHITNPGRVTIERCRVSHLGAKLDSHGDAVQIVGGSDFVFRDNRFDLPIGLPVDPKQFDGGMAKELGLRETHGHNAAFMIKCDRGPIADVLIERNTLDGGNFTLNIAKGPHGVPSAVVVRCNIWGKHFRYGVSRLSGDVTWEDSNTHTR